MGYHLFATVWGPGVRSFLLVNYCWVLMSTRKFFNHIGTLISLLFGKANNRIFVSEDDRMETCVCFREVPSIGPLKRNKLPTLVPNISLKIVEAQNS